MRWLLALLALLALFALALPAAAQPVRPKIAVVSIHIAELPSIARAGAGTVANDVQIDFYGLGGGLIPSIDGVDLGGYDLVLIDAAGPRLLNYSAQIEAAKARTKVLIVGAGTPITGNVDRAAYPDVQTYWDNATAENYAGLFAYLAGRILVRPVTVPPPRVFPSLTLWHPDAPGPFASLAAYRGWATARLADAADRPRIGILFYRSLVLANNTAVIAALIHEVERQGGLPVPIWREGGEDLPSTLLGDTRLDALVLCANRLDYADAAKGVAEAERLGVPPLMCATDYRRSPEAWRADIGGFAPGQIGELALGELEGIVEPMTVGARSTASDGTVGYVPLPEQVRWRVERAMAWARLHRLPNADKRIVISYHNEEPGEADVGSDPDSYMDAQASIVALITRLKAEGYDIGGDPLPGAAELARRMAAEGSNVQPGDAAALRARIASGAITVPLADYLTWYAALPEALRRSVEDRWGPPPGRIMAIDGQLVVPALHFGKVTLAAHPIWGLQADAGALASAGALPPHHQYLAFYLWMQRTGKVDAFVPFFTQLSLMPGKQAGPAADDAVGRLIGALPHIQPLPLQANGGVGNKRRTHAVTIGFMPEIVRAGLGPDLAAVSAALDKSDEAGARRAAAAARMARTVGLDPATAPWAALEPAMRRYLSEAEAAPMPVGGHVLGQPPSADVAVQLVRAMLAANGAAAPDLGAVAAALRGDDGAMGPEQSARARDFAARLAQAPRELDAIVTALAGGFVPPGPMQDALRNPDALPAGRNPYTLDVRALPTREAWATGAKLADETVALYRAEHGAPPRKVAFVLWSGESAQNGGTSEAQILRLLGTRPVWNARGQVVDVALVDRATLGRPRADVLVTTSGTYRDHFGDKLALIHRAITLAAAAGEGDNPVAAETAARTAALIRGGVPQDVARRRALRRIFSTAPGAYSPSTQFAIREGWSDARLNDLYRARLGHSYGDGEEGAGDAAAFAANLERVDAAVFSRSSSAYGVLDTPLPAAYFGGLAKAVRSATGRSIATYVANGQQPGAARIETLARFYGRERDSRYLNPAWIKGMMASGYNGARYMADLVDTMRLWEATKPDLVTAADWKAMSDVYVNDRFNLGLAEFFARSNPAAGAKLIAMLDEVAQVGSANPGAVSATRTASPIQGGRVEAPVPATSRSARPTATAPASAAGAPPSLVEGFELAEVERPVAEKITSAWSMVLVGCVVMALLLVGAAVRPNW